MYVEILHNKKVIIINIINIILWNESLTFKMSLINQFIYWPRIFWPYYMLDIVNVPVFAIKGADCLADR